MAKNIFQRLADALSDLFRPARKPPQLLELPRIELPQLPKINLELPAIFQREEEPEEEETDEERFANDFGIDRVKHYEPGPQDRGPYYGRDQFLDKLAGMKSAWGYIEGITMLGTGGIERYYITIDDSGYKR